MIDNQVKNKKLNVIVRDRNALVFEGSVEGISSFNDKGPFDILAQHANFITLIKKELVLHLTDRQEKRVDATSGVLKIRDNMIEIYLGILR